MAKIRFWKWQHTDEFGLPGFTRLPISKAKDKKPDDPDEVAWPLERVPRLPGEALRRRPPPH